MPEPISLFHVIKQGGFDASLITTFNASLPFYEEVVLRRLVASGCQQNIVLMDYRQCAASWQSDTTRPKLAGTAYSLLPLKVPGAFHPKVCILAGKAKAAVLVGSHNLTLSGFGYNREITNWVNVSGRTDSEGAAFLDAVWRMVLDWIELGRANLPSSLIEAALSFSKSLAPLSLPGLLTKTVVLHQQPGRLSLIDQIAERIEGQVLRIAVIGAFFDSKLAFINHLHERWPQADIVVAIDPDTVHLPSMRDVRARFVDARSLWTKSENGGNKYLHAKVLYVERTHEDGNILISGSANPSRPAWMGTQTSGNVEAVILRTGSDAQSDAEALGLCEMFALEPIAVTTLETVVARSVAESWDAEGPIEHFWIGVTASATELEIATTGSHIEVDSASVLTEDLEVVESNIGISLTGHVLRVPVTVNVKLVRSCDLYFKGERVARAMIEHPHILSASTKPSHRQIRDALGALDPSGESIAEMLKAVENAIFDTASEQEVEREVRTRRGLDQPGSVGGAPESLEISITQLRQTKKRRRLVESADIVTLIDLLTRRIGAELNTQPSIPLDAAGRSEEEQINQDDDLDDSGERSETEEKPLGDAGVQSQEDAEIAKKVSKKIAKLVSRMLEKLVAATIPDGKVRAIIQLVAVLSLIKELFRIERLPRWRAAREFLVHEKERRRLLDESVKCLFGSKSRLIDTVSNCAQQESEEVIQLRVLLLWLAWSVGDKVPEAPVNVFDIETQQETLRTKAMFLALVPSVAVDDIACGELRRYIAATHRQNPATAARAESWIRLITEFGEFWSRELTDAPQIEVGGCCLVGEGNYPRLVSHFDNDYVHFWDYEGIRSYKKYKKSIVIPVQPKG